MEHLGDITRISGHAAPVVDIITGGSPCQDLSVAGKRAGLAGQRSGLFMEQVRIIKEMREEDRKNGRTDEFIRPRYMVWENVPGAFSSNDGEDFRAVLEETARITDKDAVIPRPPGGIWQPSGCILGDGWSIAWRVHDAQFWGIPQRRKRISLVADFGGTTAPEILFERKSVSGDSEPSGTERKETAGTVGTGTSRPGKSVIGFNRERCGAVTMEDAMPTLQAAAGESGNNKPMVMQNKEVAGTVGTSITEANGFPLGFRAENTRVYDEAVITYGLDRASFNQGKNAKYGISVEEEKIGAQVARGPGAVCNSVVRRLTPLECERLQGYPVVRKVRFTEMTKDEYIAWNINEGHIVVDTENGKVFATRGPGGVKIDEPRELVGSVVNGYKVVSIRNGETKMQCRVHRIVWIAEHGIIPNGFVIDHINNDKQDNRICNLQLMTATENSTKARADGLYKVHGDAGQAKITDEVHDFIQYVYGNTDLSIRQLSEIFDISKSRVQQIIHDEPWTDIGDWVDSKGKTHKGDADSPRYKALGNSIALPFWQWMAERMVKYIDHQPTMASLFDGIGGFPLVFSRCGCEPVWASEIEEFPIAVTKKRF